MGIVHWLVDHGALNDLVAFGVGYGCAKLIGIARHFRRLLSKQDRIIDLLDTDTPGGLHEILSAYEGMIGDKAAKR